MDCIQIITGLVAVGSFGVAVWARLDARKALAAARRSATAAENSVGINQQLFDAGRVCLELRPAPNANHRYELVNLGTHPAYEVKVSAPEVKLSLPIHFPQIIRPGMRVPLIAAPEIHITDRRIFASYKATINGDKQTTEFHI